MYSLWTKWVPIDHSPKLDFTPLTTKPGFVLYNGCKK